MVRLLLILKQVNHTEWWANMIRILLEAVLHMVLLGAALYGALVIGLVL